MNTVELKAEISDILYDALSYYESYQGGVDCHQEIIGEIHMLIDEALSTQTKGEGEKKPESP